MYIIPSYTYLLYIVQCNIIRGIEYINFKIMKLYFRYFRDNFFKYFFPIFSIITN